MKLSHDEIMYRMTRWTRALFGRRRLHSFRTHFERGYTPEEWLDGEQAPWRPAEDPPPTSDTVMAIVPLRWMGDGWWFDEGLAVPMDVPAPAGWRHRQPSPSPKEAVDGSVPV